MHRISVFRDDVIFILYMIQRRVYPVDTSRPAEGFDDEAEGAQQGQEEEAQAPEAEEQQHEEGGEE
jgi:hypothetical protein